MKFPSSHRARVLTVSTLLCIACLCGRANPGVSTSSSASSLGTAQSGLKAKDSDTLSVAVFAGGSFWCLEPVFEALPGVIAAESGYMGGTDTNPTFDAVSDGKTGHAEAVLVRFNSKTIGYAKLLDAYWRNIDPTRADGQFTDEGPQFRTVIFYRDDAQKRAAEASKLRLEKSKRFGSKTRVVTEIMPASKFYPADERNQDFYKKNPGRYHTYVNFSGRDKFFKKYWANPVRTAR